VVVAEGVDGDVDFLMRVAVDVYGTSCRLSVRLSVCNRCIVALGLVL